tara:strand:- start:250 stop:501 length:252 start_codon:yes stop_codon:yes gene_type:complete
MTIQKDEMIKEVYTMLKDREINPSGYFDDGGRWFSHNADLIDVREPSRAWPYSQLTACRSRKYVAKIAEKHKVETVQQLIKCV